MFAGGVTQLLRDGGDTPGWIREQNGCSGHSALCFFLQKSPAVMLLQIAFCLPGGKSQTVGQFFQRKLLILVQKVLFCEDGFAVINAGACKRRAGFVDLSVIAYHGNDQQAEQGLYCHGIDGWWCDSSEAVCPEWERSVCPPPAVTYQDFVESAGKVMPIDKINAYGLYHARGVFEGKTGVTREKRVLNLTRSRYPWSQKYGTILWSGDISATCDTLKKQVTEGLSFCSAGLSYWTMDIGAFFVKQGVQWFWNGDYPKGLEDPGYRELYVRWFQYGAFLPVFRSHGTDCPRETWNFGAPGDACYDAIQKVLQLRYELMLYIYSLAGADGRFTLYEDAGDRYGYEQGEYCVTEITYSDQDRTISVKTEGDLKYHREMGTVFCCSDDAVPRVIS